MLFSEGLRVAASWLFTAQSELVRDHIRDLIHQQSTSVDIAYYETPEYHDHLHRARDESYYRPMMLLESAGTVVPGWDYVDRDSGPADPIQRLAAPDPDCLGRCQSLYLALRMRLREHLWRLRITKDERRAWYYDWLLTTSDTAAEMRTLDLGVNISAHFIANCGCGCARNT